MITRRARQMLANVSKKTSIRGHKEMIKMHQCIKPYQQQINQIQQHEQRHYVINKLKGMMITNGDKKAQRKWSQNEQRNYDEQHYDREYKNDEKEQEHTSGEKIKAIIGATLRFSLHGVFLCYIWFQFKDSLFGSNIFNQEQGYDRKDFQHVTFDEVKGIDDVREEVEEIVSFLKHPERYTEIGATLPKGVILEGPPGTGKTILAKAVATEADVAFFYASGSQFDEMFVGMGASRVRSLFQMARKNTPCVLFIDEIDTIGGKRDRAFATNRQTLNQLLQELDGINSRDNIVVLGATNLISNVDSALLRPGRFDRHIGMALPTVDGREDLFKLYLKKKRRYSSSINYKDLAKLTRGLSGADIENIVNNAAIDAVKHNDPFIGQENVERAIDRQLIGVELKSRHVEKEDTYITAVHEIGHALVSMLRNTETTSVNKVTVIPRNTGSAGHTSFMPSTDSSFRAVKKAHLMREIESCLGGLAAEEVMLGKENRTLGAESDLKRARAIAERMVKYFGMSRLGPSTYYKDERTISNETKQKIDEEIEFIISTAYKNVCNLLNLEKKKMTVLVDKLVEHETLTGEQLKEFYEML